MTTRTKSQIGKSNVRRSRSHERRVAKLLTEWSDVKFRRRKVEGRDISTIARESTSDVIAVDRIFKFSVEAKCGKGFSLDALLASAGTAIFTSWWFQASYDAHLLSQYLKQQISPMLFFKPGINFDWVAIPIDHLESMGISNKPMPKNNIKLLQYITYYYNTPVSGNISHGTNKQIIKMKLRPVAMCRWKDFAINVDPSKCFYDNGPPLCS